jgi:hypothetical protein
MGWDEWSPGEAGTERYFVLEAVPVAMCVFIDQKLPSRDAWHSLSLRDLKTGRGQFDRTSILHPTEWPFLVM